MFRWWLNRTEGGDVAHIELSCPSHSWFSIAVEFSGWSSDNAIHGHVSLLRCGFYWGYSGFGSAWARRVREQEYQLAVHDGGIWLDLGSNPNEWSRTDPWWRRWHVYPADVLFGRKRHSEAHHSTTETALEMPEGTYPCRVVLKDETWKRPRLPWASLRIRRAHIEMAKPVPVPGKGENSWDIDDDAIYSITGEAQTVEEGLAMLREEAMRSRTRYGGASWAPETGGAA